ncbi:hypothetical protein V2J09_020947 [Rumex salicifolius]
MEDPVKPQQLSSATTASNGKSKLRYPLRSSTTKLTADKSPTENSVSTHKRGRATLSVSKSVNLASLSANDKSSKPVRRLSIPAKRTVSPRPKPSSKNTPTSDNRARRSLSSQGKSDTPASHPPPKSSTRPKFNVLSSASYWLSQIKLSESVPNHALSLGFFKLALEAGCEPLHRLRDELKSYVLKHNMTKLEETVSQLFEIYGISETLGQIQVSESCSHVPEEGTLSSIETVQKSNSPTGEGKLKLKSLNTEAPKVPSGKKSLAKFNASKTTATSSLRGSVSRKSVTQKLVQENGTQNPKRKTAKAGSGQLPSNEQDKIKQENKSAGEAPSKPLETEEVVYENKENMDAAVVEKIRVI